MATKRLARTTTSLGIPVPGDDDRADYVGAWGTTADAIDAAVTKAVADARAEFATTVANATAEFASAIADARTAGSRPARTAAFLLGT